MERALSFFEQHSVKATFFVVGNELETNSVIRASIKSAFEAGHEIENHTYSHPFGLATLSREEVMQEIGKCSEIVESITGKTPVGFRSPGYSMNTEIINLLRENGFRYDSSGFWSVMNPVLKYSHKFIFRNGLKNEGFGYVTRQLPQSPYRPSTSNWLNQSNSGNFFELPLPRTSLGGLPFYNNFNLWAPSFYFKTAAASINKPYIVYLFHIVEFMDLSDGIPKELICHPNIKIPVSDKLRLSGSIVHSLSRRYSPKRTLDIINF